MSEWLEGRARNVGCPHSRWKLAWATARGSLRDGHVRLMFRCVWLCLRYPDIFWQGWRQTKWEDDYAETPGYRLAERILG